jgi:hypothetical protein
VGHLAARAAAGETRVTLSFAAIEGAILGRPLPASARSRRNHRAWWGSGNTNYPHRWYGWLRAGWQVEAVDLAAETVTFARLGATDGGGGNVTGPREPHGGYRTILSPGPGLALVAEPDGRERLWARLRSTPRAAACANCGRLASPGYRPSAPRPGEPRVRLCAACVEGDA